MACGLCEGIVTHPGAFAEFLTLPEQNLHAVPPGIPLPHAVFVEPLAAEVAGMISDSFPLREARSAFRRAQQKGVLKVLLCDNKVPPA